MSNPASTSASQETRAPLRCGARGRPSGPFHCTVLVESRYLGHAQPAGLMRALAAAGVRVTLIDPAARLLDVGNSRWIEGVDVIVARGRSTDLLARLSVAEAAGVPTLNSRRAIEAVVDKAHMAARLRAAGISTPATWVGAIEQVRRSIPPASFPLILKPVFGDNARGIRIVETPEQLRQLAWTESCAIAQQLLPGGGFDIKLYVIGERVWAIRKPSPLLVSAGAVTPLTVSPAWRELALRCGELFGLQLFGVDCIAVEGRLQVIEVNDFPNYTGVDAADLLLARHVAQQIKARRHA